MKKIILPDEDRKKIAAAVKEAESKTSGEITTALIQESSDYAFFELRASLFFAILVYMIQLLFFSRISQAAESFIWNSPSWQTPMVIGIVSLLAGGIFYFVSNLPAVDRIIVPSGIMAERVRARALRHFTESGVYATADGTGILIFISLMERRVELIADKGISEKIPEEDWQSLVDDLTGKIGSGDITAGLEQTILSCGEKLKSHFPIADDDQNELSDQIVILED